MRWFFICWLDPISLKTQSSTFNVLAVLMKLKTLDRAASQIQGNIKSKLFRFKGISQTFCCCESCKCSHWRNRRVNPVVPRLPKYLHNYICSLATQLIRIPVMPYSTIKLHFLKIVECLIIAVCQSGLLSQSRESRESRAPSAQHATRHRLLTYPAEFHNPAIKVFPSHL